MNRERIKGELTNVHAKGYIATGFVANLTGFFAVPKGPTDTRMVYDASVSGLNVALWVPTFAMPSSHSLVDVLTEESWMIWTWANNRTVAILLTRCTAIFRFATRANCLDEVDKVYDGAGFVPIHCHERHISRGRACVGGQKGQGEPHAVERGNPQLARYGEL